MNLPWVYMHSPSWTPSQLPPHPIPLGHPSAPALSTLSHASNLDWWFISHMIIYMFQCHSPKSSHPRPLPQSPKDCSIHLCLFCWEDSVSKFSLGTNLLFILHLPIVLFNTHWLSTYYVLGTDLCPGNTVVCKPGLISASCKGRTNNNLVIIRMMKVMRGQMYDAKCA